MRTTTLLFILLHAATLTGNDLVIEKVRSEAPLIRIAPSDDHLRRWRRVAGNYDACTTFIGFRLEATCGADAAGSWTMRTSAAFRPWITLRNLHSLSHENEHIRDMEKSVDAYLNDLDRLRFDSNDACRAKALEEREGFGTAMLGFALESNMARHPNLALARASRLRKSR